MSAVLYEDSAVSCLAMRNGQAELVWVARLNIKMVQQGTVTHRSTSSMQSNYIDVQAMPLYQHHLVCCCYQYTYPDNYHSVELCCQWTDDVASICSADLTLLMFTHKLNTDLLQCRDSDDMAHMSEAVPSNQAQCCHIKASLGWPPQSTWEA